MTEMMHWRNMDLELEFVREFSHGGDQIGATLSIDGRRERIRVAILREGKRDLIFRDTQETYEAVYTRCYGSKLDLRRFPRDLPASATLALDEREEEPDDGEEDFG
jgi:hypothetical protein